jgi:hypothetical protein
MIGPGHSVSPRCDSLFNADFISSSLELIQIIFGLYVQAILVLHTAAPILPLSIL